MKKISLLTVSLTMTILAFISAGHCATVILYPSVDTYVTNGAPNDSMGTRMSLYVGRDDFVYRSFLKFDLSNIPNDVMRTTADLKLYSSMVISAQDYNLSYVFEDGKITNTMTWNS